MKINKIPFLFFLFLFLAIIQRNASATHLMGGNLAYEYLGETFAGSGMYRYRIIFKTYTDCGPLSNFQDGPETVADIGIYHESQNPGSNKQKFIDLTINLTETNRITPDNPSGCTIGEDVCIDEGVYITTVDLPVMPNGVFSKGYHLYYDRCCRNGNIVNLANPGGEGMGFHAFIPSPITVNSSPIFTDFPLPFICVNDTTGILNTAIDPDGDLLIFSFEDPYEGQYTGDGMGGNPSPAIGPSFGSAYPDPLDWTLPVINWQTGGFDKNNPFGPSVYAFINSFTGYTQYKPTSQGNHVIAVEVKEFRNGNLIGISRRDMQLLVLNCPVNDAPVLSNSGGSGQTSYIVEEGQPLCFPVAYTDTNGNSITMTASGNIFNSAFTNPAATINTPVTGNGTVSSTFCWNTGCNQGQALPYLFNAQATDDGCPPKTTPIVYSITVNNFNGPTTVTGTNIVCPGASANYSIASVSGATYNWVVTGGTVSSGQGTNSISVNWGNGPSGNVAVTTTSQFGCPSGPVNLPVTFNNAVLALAGTDKTLCAGDTVTIGGSPTAPAGTTVSWIPSAGLSNANTANPLASPLSTTTYIVSVSDTNGCVGKDTVLVTVNALPVVNAGNDTSVCISDTVQLFATATAASSFSWTPSTGLSDPNIQNPLAFPTDTTLYSVIITDINNCNDTDEVTVFVITTIPAEAGADTTICKGQQLMLGGFSSVPPGTQFNWSPNSNLNNNTVQNPVATADSTITYFITTTLSGCTGMDSVQLIVNPLPVVQAGNDTTVCANEIVPLNASGGVTYLWIPAQFLDNSGIANPVSVPTDSVIYSVVVSDANNCSDTGIVVVNVNPLPLADAGEDAWVCPGDSVQLIATGGNFFSWTPSSGLSNNGIASPQASPSDSTLYFVTVTNLFSCSKMDSVTVFVNGTVPTDAGNDVSICLNGLVQIGGAPTSSNGTVFSWTPATGLSSDTVSNPFANPGDTMMYYVFTTNDTCTGTDSVLVIVNPLPVAEAGNDTSVCSGDTALLVASGGNTFLWNTGETNDSITSTMVSDTTYFVTVTDGNNCSNNDSVVVNINPLPVVITSALPSEICVGDSALLVAGGGTFYLWNTGEINDSITAAPADTAAYFVTVTDGNNCSNNDSVIINVNPLPVVITSAFPAEICLGDSALLIAGGGTFYLWNTGEMNDSVFAVAAVTVTYFVTVTDGNNCSVSDSVLVTVNPLPVVDAGNNTAVCIGDTIQLNAISSGNVFLWNSSPTLSNINISNPAAFPQNSTVYFVNVTDENSCANSDSVLVNVNQLPVVNAGLDINSCKNSAVVLGGSPTAPLNSIYQWFPSGNLDDATSGNPVATPDSTITYVVNVTDINGCKNSDSALVSIFSVSSISDTSFCIGDSISLFVIPVSETNPVVYQWSPPVGLNTDDVAVVSASPSANTVYNVTVTDAGGCMETKAVSVEARTPPVADFIFLLHASCRGVLAEFKNTSEDADSYQWIFGDGKTSSGENTTHVFSYSELMEVSLTASNEFCTASKSHNENIKSFSDYFDLKPPNIFTPNADAVNDCFEIDPDNKLQECTEMRVYNRWGELLYISAGNQHSWCGRNFAGENVPSGTYFYIFDIHGILFKGAVMLMR